MTVLRGRARPATKINITFFVGYEALNIFLLTIKKNIYIFQKNVLLQNIVLSSNLKIFIMRSILYEERVLKKLE